MVRIVRAFTVWFLVAALLGGLAYGVLVLSRGEATPTAPPLSPSPHGVTIVLVGAPAGPSTRVQLALLNGAKAKAVFAIVGRQALREPGLVRALARQGFPLANEGYRGTGTPADLRHGADVVLEITGRPPAFTWSAKGPATTPTTAEALAPLLARIRPGTLLLLPSSPSGAKALARALAALRSRKIAVAVPR
jgi:hypothetical protein